MSQRRYPKVVTAVSGSTGYSSDYGFVFSDREEDWWGKSANRRKKQREDYELRVKPMREAQKAFKNKMPTV